MRLRLLPRPLGIATLALALAGCSSGEPGPEGDPVLGPEPFLNLAPDVAYTGMDACRSCHLGVHSTYAGSGMARSFARLEQQDLGTDARAFIVGSGNHLAARLVERGGVLERAPVCRHAGATEWTPCPDGDRGQPHVTGATDLVACLGCHDVADPLRVGAPRGVDCERCHGPGALHVERWKSSPERGSGSADPTIVNPRRLPPSGRMAVCLQCHLGDSRSSARIPRVGRAVEEFRPGMPFEAVWSAWRVAPSPLEFGAAAQGDRMMLSRCYLESDGRMDCTTCHNPHVSVYHEDRPDDLFRVQCLGCHAVEDCVAPAAARERTSPADDCVDCHMRRGEPIDQQGTQYTDHWIRKSPGAEVAHGATACELEPVLEAAEVDPEGERAYYRARAWMEIAGGADDHPCAEALDRALDDLARAVDSGFDLPEARALLDRR